MCSGHYFRRRRKGEVGMAEDSFRKMFHKVKYPALCPLMFAEGLIVHKEIEDFILLGDLVDPINKFIHCKRIIRPRFFREPKGDIITQTEVFQQYLEFWLYGIDVHII